MKVVTISAAQYRQELLAHKPDTQWGSDFVGNGDFTWFDFSEEVTRGAEMLDAQDPEWHTKVDVGWLELSNGSACVLGQLAMQSFRHMVEAEEEGIRITGYHSVVEKLYARGLVTDDWGADHGFSIPKSMYAEYANADDPRFDEYDMQAAWEHLTWQWADVVEKRLANKPV